MKVIKNTFLLTCLFMAIACKKENQENNNSLQYKYFNLEKAGWKSSKHTQEVENINYTATEVPLPYYILKDLGTKNLTSIDSINKVNEHERIIEFEFVEDKENDLLQKQYTQMDYKESIMYLSFTINKDFYVVTSHNDTIQCEGVTFERNFKLSPRHKILLFFSGINPTDKIQLVYQDNLFKKGMLKFNFNENLTKILP